MTIERQLELLDFIDYSSAPILIKNEIDKMNRRKAFIRKFDRGDVFQEVSDITLIRPHD